MPATPEPSRSDSTPPVMPWSSTAPLLARITEDVLFGDIWEREELSKRDRSLITVAILGALYRTDNLRNHLGRALENGVTPEELSEMCTHLAFYAGWPTGVNMAQLLDGVLDSHSASSG